MKKIKLYRGVKGITQAELARRLGVTRAYINKLESDKYHSISKKLVKRLCEVFEVDAFDIDILKIVPQNSREFEKVIYILEKERKKYETEKTNWTNK